MLASCSGVVGQYASLGFAGGFFHWTLLKCLSDNRKHFKSRKNCVTILHTKKMKPSLDLDGAEILSFFVTGGSIFNYQQTYALKWNQGERKAGCLSDSVCTYEWRAASR